MTRALPLRPLEVAAGAVVGAAPGPCPPLVRDGRRPLAALEDALRPALSAPGPCVVSYSGGRDSALLLAVAARLAARERLPAPVAATLRFPGDPDAEETAWQELGVHGLALGGWVRHEVQEGELDLLGPAATGLLERHGLTWPYNVHFHAPLVPIARGGTLLIGFDGDGLLDGWRWAAAGAFRGRRVPLQRRAVRVVGLSLSPRAVRARVIARREVPTLSWLTPAAAMTDVRMWAAQLADEPRHWPARLAWFAHRRHLAVARESFDLLGADACAVAFPLMDAGFLGALADAGGRWGYRDRTEALARAMPGVLDPRLARRHSKASFDAAFWGPRAREFAQDWDGAGLDPALVDAGALAREWRGERPNAMSCHLLHAAWLARGGSGESGEERGARGE